MTFNEYKQLCLKYNLQLLSYDGRDYGVCNVPFVGWGNHIRVIPERVWKDELLSDNGKYLTYKGEFQYYPDEIKKNDTQAFENYLIKLTAWLKQLRIDTKLQLIQKDFK
jgi:hypothetical protein